MTLALTALLLFLFHRGMAAFLQPVIRDTFQGARHSRAWGTYAVLLLLAIGLTPFIGLLAVLQDLTKRVRGHA